MVDEPSPTPIPPQNPPGTSLGYCLQERAPRFNGVSLVEHRMQGILVTDDSGLISHVRSYEEHGPELLSEDHQEEQNENEVIVANLSSRIANSKSKKNGWTECPVAYITETSEAIRYQRLFGLNGTVFINKEVDAETQVARHASATLEAIRGEPDLPILLLRPNAEAGGFFYTCVKPGSSLDSNALNAIQHSERAAIPIWRDVPPESMDLFLRRWHVEPLLACFYGGIRDPEIERQRLLFFIDLFARGAPYRSLITDLKKELSVPLNSAPDNKSIDILLDNIDESHFETVNAR